MPVIVAYILTITIVEAAICGYIAVTDRIVTQAHLEMTLLSAVVSVITLTTLRRRGFGRAAYQQLKQLIGLPE